MRNHKFSFQVKKKNRISWFNVIFVVVILLSLTRIADKVGVYLDLRSEIAVCEMDLSAVEEDYAAKQEVVELLQDESYLEYMARKELGMVHEGEHLVWSLATETP